MLQAFVINLQADAARRQRISAQLAALPEIRPTILRAVDGAALPQAAATLLSGDQRWGKNFRGTIGCFLSHLAAWEQIAAIPEKHALVLEDDAEVSRLPGLDLATVPSDADVVFLNHRMSPGSSAEDQPPSFVPIVECLRQLDRTGKGPGGDGYLLSAAAAAKLLSAVSAHLCFGHVDWRLLYYCVTEQDLAALAADSKVAQVLRQHGKRLGSGFGLLRGYGVSRPLIRHTPKGTSSRSEGDTK